MRAADVSIEGVREAVRSGGLLAEGEMVVAMLSGGRDSTCLLDVAVALRSPAEVIALHVNYGLREAAGAEERHCRELCSQLGVEIEVVHPERLGEASQAASGEASQDASGEASQDASGEASQAASGNLQAWAREVRYEAARGLAGRRGGVFATGHTASDQVETILYRLAASPGRRALLGMLARDGPLVRPLLAVTREQTAAYCRERGLRWCEDESNEDRRFARARVRHELLPALRTVHPAAEENVLRTARLLGEESELLEALVAEELAGGESIAVARLESLPPALARMIVVRLAERATGRFIPQAGERVGEIVELSGRGGRRELHVGGGAGAVVAGGVLTMRPLAPRGGGPPPERSGGPAGGRNAD